MRVAHVVESFSPLTETFIYDTIVESVKQGVEAYVVTNAHLNTDDRPFDHVYVTQAQPKWHPQRVWSRLRTTLKLQHPDEYTASIRFGSYRDLLKRLKPDVIHAHFGNIGYWLLPVASSLNIPLVVSFYGYDASLLTTDPIWIARYSQLSKSVNTICTSNFLRNKLLEIGFLDETTYKIHAGIDLGKIQHADPLKRFDGKNVHCLHVGRLVEKKAPLHLVKAFAMARRALLPEMNLQLTIAGDGPLFEPLVNTVSDLAIEDAVTLLGAVSHSEALKLFAQAHIYTQHCVTSASGDQEGMGVSFAEASAHGLPIISTWHNGIPEVVIDGKSGYLVPEGDIEGMAEKLITLCKSPQQWSVLGFAGRSHVENNLSLEVETRKYLEILNKVVRNGH